MTYMLWNANGSAEKSGPFCFMNVAFVAHPGDFSPASGLPSPRTRDTRPFDD